MSEFYKQYAKSLALGEDFEINDDITIHSPTVGEIIRFGENNYFSLIYIFCSTSSDYKAQLDSVGVDWQDLSDFDMFRQLFMGNKDKDMSILFGDLDTQNFAMALDNQKNEVVLRNKLTGVVIDRLTYDLISEYFCSANGIKKHTEKAANEATRKALIMEAQDKLLVQRTEENEPRLMELALSMACCPGFKADYFGAMDYPISVFMNHVRKIQQINDYEHTMHGVYAGTVEFGKIPKSQLDWMSKPK